MANALQQALSQTALDSAWQRLLRNTPRRRRLYGAGLDGITVTEFQRSATPILARVAKQLRDGTYSFSKLRPVPIDKKSGGVRLICVPTIKDRIVQRALLNYLVANNRCKIRNDLSYGFVKERGVQSALSKAKELRRENGYVLKTDISHFFDNIQRDTLAGQIRSVVRASSLYPLLEGVINCEISHTEQFNGEDFKQLGLKKGLGLRQGMPLSPLYANIVLRDFDQAIADRRYAMVRYADDLIFFAKSKSQCYQIFKYAQEQLAALGLRIPVPGTSHKSQILVPNQAVEFLGLALTPVKRCKNEYAITLTKPQKERLKKRVQRFSDLEWLDREGITISRYFQKLDGVVQSYLGAYSVLDDFEDFRGVMDDYRKSAIEKLFKHDLGLDLSAFGPTQQKFLLAD